MGCVQNSFSCFGQLSSRLVANVGRCLLGRSSLNGRISLSRTPVSQKVAKIVNVIISTAHFEKRLNSLPRRSDGLDQQILEPRARVELAIPLVDEFLPLQGGQLAQLHIQDRAGLALIDVQ